MRGEEWVLDATGNDGEPPFAFCPIYGDDIMTGLTFIGLRPPGRFVGVIHADGQDAVEDWVEKHGNRLSAIEAADRSEQ